MAQRRTFMVEYNQNRKFNINIEFSVFGHFQQTMFILMANFIGNLGQVHQENARRCQVLVTFTDFGHIHLVIFIRSS